MALKRKTRTKTKKQPVLSKRQEPDIRAQAGENSSIEKGALENQQLREATKRLAADLKEKTRDLEVEAALERVRTRAMAMRNSAELAEASSVLFHQLKNLHIQVIRTSVGIFDDPNGAIELWITSVTDNREVIETLNYVNLHIHPVFKNLIPARKKGKPFAVTKLTGREVLEYYQHLSLPNQQKYNDTEYFYSFFFSQGTLNVVRGQELTGEECDILIRFASTFGLIYTRFLDLQKAEAQAREAQIEASLERVRSKALAMHQSNDLAGVVSALYSEFSALDFGIHQILLSIYDIDSNVIEWWSRGYSEGHLPQRNLIPIIDHKIFNPFFTTKPTGQGTGLGLSLSYDIITKGHGGELKVETKEGEGSEFVVQLPISS